MSLNYASGSLVTSLWNSALKHQDWWMTNSHICPRGSRLRGGSGMGAEATSFWTFHCHVSISSASCWNQNLLNQIEFQWSFFALLFFYLFIISFKLLLHAIFYKILILLRMYNCVYIQNIVQYTIFKAQTCLTSLNNYTKSVPQRSISTPFN